MKKPSVTQLLDLLNKPALLKWANKIGLEGIKLEDYQKKSKSDGISLHSQIENYISFNTQFENIEDQKKFDMLFPDKTILKTEEIIETEHFIGRIDLRINGKTNWICDFKSNDRLYFENKLQLTAYKMAYPEYNIGIVHIPSFTFDPVNIDFEKYASIIINLSNIWKVKQEIGEY